MKLLVLLINFKNKIERGNNSNVQLKFQTYFYFNIETIDITSSERKIVPRFERMNHLLNLAEIRVEKPVTQIY
jgi:hypothetical protein